MEKRCIQKDYVDLTRSYISYVETNDQLKAFLNDELGHKLLKNISYGHSGTVKTGFRVILDYKNKPIIELNKQKNPITFKLLNTDTPEYEEYKGLVDDLLNKTQKVANKVSEKTQKPSDVVRKPINKTEVPKEYAIMSDKQIEDMIIEKSKIYNSEDDSVDNIAKFREE